MGLKVQLVTQGGGGLKYYFKVRVEKMQDFCIKVCVNDNFIQTVYVFVSD